jgi:amphi-Trp domain-containing protein
MADAPDDGDRSNAAAFELERAYDRDELAAVFREFATAFEAGRPVRLDGDERSVRVAVPDRVVAELEAEHEPESTPPVTELELELEWDDETGSSLRFVDRDGSDGGTEATDAEPAAAVLSLEGVTDGSRADADEAAVTAEDGPGVDGTADSGRTSRFEVYEDNAGEWRWRLVHWNGNVVADGGEGYASRSNAERAARSVMRSAPTATIERLE